MNTNKISKLLLLCILSLFTVLIQVQGQSISKITGEVMDMKGTPLTGVTVVIKGTTNGTITDIDGRFSIEGKEESILVFSYLGFLSQELKVSGSTFLKIKLTEDTQNLDEVVVVGYGTQKKSDLTSSISSIKSTDLIKTATTSIDQGLQGRAAGVVVLNTSGQPGAATSIRIRGTSSINGNNEPLYVIDGVPVISESGSISTGALQGPPTNPMSNINPNDIASIEILKDASATSIYGARGANGVVLVTTKRGKAGSLKLNFSSSWTLQQVSRKMDMLNAIQLAELGNEVADNDGVDRNPIYAPMNNIAKGPNTNWQDEIFRLAPMQKYNIGASGGTEKNSFFVSVGILSQDGIIIGSNYKNGTLRLNFDQTINDHFKFGVSNNMSYSLSNGVVTNAEGAFASSVTSWALEMNPALPVRDENGHYTYENNTGNPNVGNPVQDALEAINRTTNFSALSNAYLEYKACENLTLKSSIGINYFNVKDQAFAGPELKRAESSPNGYANIGNRDGYSWVFENTANYNIVKGKNTISTLIGITSQSYVSEFSIAGATNFSDGTLGYNSLQSGLTHTSMSGANGWQMLSYLARVNYGYDSKYLVTITGRIDGSSKFSTGNKYGTFPSLALAWRTSQEEFLKDNALISNLKFRFSYGIVGNEGIPAYSSQGLLYPTQSGFGSGIISGMTPVTLSNNKLKWETTSQANFGIDLGILKNRINLTADLYSKQTSDLLLNVPIITNSGYDYAMKNVGDLENKGVELTLNMVSIDNQKFTWTTDLTYGFNKNEVTNLAGTTDNLAGASVLGITYWTKISKGKAIGTIYGYKTDGIVQANEDPSQIPFFNGKNLQVGDRKYVDKNSDGKIDETDLYELGNANPSFTYGFNNTFSLKLKNKSNLALSLYLQGVQSNKIVNFNSFALESFNGYRNNSTAALERWTPNNPSNKYPRATTQSAGNVLSDHQVEDGSYLRIKDINLAYSFSPDAFSKYGIAGLSIYVSAKNIYTFTKYSGYDPEVSRFSNNNLSMGADYGAYPISKMYEIGFKLNF